MVDGGDVEDDDVTGYVEDDASMATLYYIIISIIVDSRLHQLLEVPQMQLCLCKVKLIFRTNFSY